MDSGRQKGTADLERGAGRQEASKSEAHGEVGALRRPPEAVGVPRPRSAVRARGPGQGAEGRARGKGEPRGVPDLELQRAGSGEGGSRSGRGGGGRRRARGGGRREGRAVAAAAPGGVSVVAGGR